MTTQILATVPFLVLIALYLAAFYWCGITRLVAIAIALVAFAVWMPLRHMHFLHEWSSQGPLRTSAGETVEESVGYYGSGDVHYMKDLYFMDRGMSIALRQHDDPHVRYNAAVLLALRSHVADQSAMCAALDDPEFCVRLASAIALWRHNSPDITYNDITGLETKDSLANYLRVSQLPDRPVIGGENEEWKNLTDWEAFIQRVKADFGNKR